MSSWKYVIPLTPIAWQRTGRSWRHLKPFDPQKEEKLIYGITMQSQMPDVPPLSGPIKLEAQFYFNVAHSRRRQAERESWKYHHFRPDIDNLTKFICDVAESVGILSNDSIIAVLNVQKLWTLNNDARTEFILTQL